MGRLLGLLLKPCVGGIGWNCQPPRRALSAVFLLVAGNIVRDIPWVHMRHGVLWLPLLKRGQAVLQVIFTPFGMGKALVW